MKKKWLIGLMALCLSFATIAFVGCGESCNGDNESGDTNIEQGGEETPTPEKPASEGLEYEESEDGTYYIVTGIGTCEDTDIIIPSTYNEKPVKGIGDSAFAECSTLTSLIIPNSVTTVGRSAFMACNAMTSICISDNVTSIGEGAFVGISLINIEVDENNANYKAIDDVLYTKDGKTLLQYPIGKTATSFVIPDTVEKIEGDAFCSAIYLKNITIGNNVKEIGSAAFYDCYLLTELVIPASVKIIGSYAFDGCEKLTTVQFMEGINTIYSGAFQSCENLNELVLPNTLKEIGDGAFCACDNLANVVIGDELTRIGASAFSGNTKLTSITFNGTVEEWNVISKGNNWNSDVPATKVVCSDGEVNL